MGFFDNVGCFFSHDVPNFFTHEIPTFFMKTLPAVGKDMVNTTKDVVGYVKDTVKDVFGTAKDGVKDVVHEVGGTVQSLGNTAKDTIVGTSANLSMPLAIAAAVVGMAFLLRKQP